MRGISDRQRAILDFIAKKVESDGYPPSVREICSAVGLKSPSTVHVHLERLEQAGLISKQDRKMRALRLGGSPRGSEPAVSVPILGRVTAGAPILAVEEVEGYIPVPRRKAQGRELFALRIEGESMINAGIMDGDIVVAEKTSTADNGDIVVALLGEEATVKRFFMEKGRFRLQPENTLMSPIIVRDLQIIGRVIACFRYYR